MKVLFVCAQNVGRSQMAAVFYNKLTGTKNADSAGTIVNIPGQTIAERAETIEGAKHVLLLMRYEGVDIGANVRKQITEPMLADYEKIIVMAEPDTIPEWLRSSRKYVYWSIQDARFLSIEATGLIRDQIRNKVEQLIEEETT